MRRILRPLEDGWEWLMGADPGQLRIAFALRLALMATITVLGLIGIGLWGRMPIGAIGLGFMIAQFNAGAVRDPTRWGQALTTVVVALAGLAGATLASLIAPWPVGSDVMLVALVFAATAAHAAGPRAMAAGMLGFIGFYLNLIIQVKLAEVPFEVAAAAYAACVALLVRLVILPERPGHSLPRVLRSVRRQAARLLEAVIAVTDAGGGHGWSQRLTRRSARLEEAIEAVEDQIERLGGSPAEHGWNRLSMELEDLQTHVLRIARLCRPGKAAAPHPRFVGGMAHAIAALGLSAPEHRVQAAGGTLPADHDDALTRLAGAIERLPTRPRAILAAARERVAAPVTDDDAAKPTASAAEPWPARLLALLRQPVQVAVATGAAIAAGHAVSGQRWYWSVLAVFIVFAGTASRTTTLTKAAQRVLGTLLGVGAGILIAEAVLGDPKLIVALALVCDVIAFYAFQTAYGVMIFWITIMIALLYGLLGAFRPELLAIRFDETAVGAAAGIIVALTLLPRRTSDE
ncbi:MAG: FUSC family protein, partial [Acetobacteraceae bacterium]